MDEQRNPSPPADSAAGAAGAAPDRAATAAAGSRVAREPPRFWISLLQLGALWTFACVWPLFDLLRHNAEFFVARGNTSGDVLILAFGFTLVPPLALAAAVALARRVRPVLGWALQVGLIGVLVGLIVLAPLGDALSGSAAAGIAVALAAAVAAGLLYARVETARWLVTVLSPAPLVALALFVVFSPVSKIVFDSGAEAAAAGGVKGDTPVVMIVFDELPAISLMDSSGRIDARRVPSFARLARDATWYRDATTVADGTEQAVPALLSGSRPVKGQLPIARDHPHSLFTLLGGHYRFDVVESLTTLCPDQLCARPAARPTGSRLRSLASDLGVVEGRLLLPAGLRDHLPPTDRNWQGFTGGGGSASGSAGAAAAAAASRDVDPAVAASHPEQAYQQFMSNLRRPKGTRPPLDFVHLVLPHVPWHYLPDGRQYPDPGYPGLPNDKWNDEPTRVNQGWERHLLQTGYADTLLGKILDRLHRIGIYDRALVVVAADHGVSFRPGGHRRSVTDANFPEIANPPLFVKLPGQHSGRVSDEPVRTIDVLPTIAKLLGAHPPGWKFDGAPFSSHVPGRREVTVSAYDGRTVSVPFATFARERDRRLAYQARLLGRSDDPYALGAPDGEDIGKHVSALNVEPPAGPRATLGDPDALSTVDLGSGIIPSYVTGSVSGAPAGMSIALALNGRIAATTRTYSAGGGAAFSALLSPAALRSGANELKAYEILPGGALRALSTGPLTSASAGGYRLSQRGGRTRLTHAGAAIAVAPGAVRGFVDFGGANSQVANLAGWAAARAPADRVVAFAGAKLIAVVQPHNPRPDVVAALNGDRRVLNSGFVASVPIADLRCGTANGGVRFFAIADGRASELALRPNIEAILRNACKR